ncbi:beta-glucosidase [Aspergillus steynii IBT 23096]|uniref:Probable beta-glucosidase G n=1 Tax=Aspergillus steynii IBT 23096 TaxID=1392250 RepID=A0A2I2G8V8_9EURO|nr:beta-glucosidase [Aspergillus steynii IBT 23096]PLB49315.1 beta-glucosidase [Aspergillus steynii IBT 23096]
MGVKQATLLSTLFSAVIASPAQQVSSIQHVPSTPSYLTPAIDTAKWNAATEQANALIEQMNLTEKSTIVTGNLGVGCIGNVKPIERIGFPGLCMLDGPTAVHTGDLASVFPAGVTVASAWDKDLFYQRGFLLATEFRGKGANVFLGPVAGPLGRNPLGGRNWEGFSPDPYLTGIAMDLTIRGNQDAGVQVSAKHYVGNEQETQRSNTPHDGKPVDGISSNIDDRTMHELYVWPFAHAVRAGASSIMCSYNRLNFTYTCENPRALNQILKQELGFDGYVVSDWFATHSGVKAITAGLDMTMPGPIDPSDFSKSYFGGNLTAAVKNGTVSETRVNDMVKRVLTPYFYLGQDKDYPTPDPSVAGVMAQTYGRDFPDSPQGRDVRGDHAKFIRQTAAEATVLLKNTNSLLPLKKPMPSVIGVFGNDAADLTQGMVYDGPRLDVPDFGFDIGTLVIGGGSGGGRNSYIVSPLEAMKARAKKHDCRLQYITDNAVIAKNDFVGIYPIPDVCLVFLKTWAREAVDRLAFEADHNSTQVVNNVARKCNQTVVITHSAGINTMPWANNPNVSAILVAHYPGQETGNSIADVIFGDVNPSGRLPYTIAKKEEDYNTGIFNLTGPSRTDSSAWKVDFDEGLFIDYRHFDRKNVTPLYEFGYGLSYTTFDFSKKASLSKKKLNIPQLPPKASQNRPGGNPELWKEVLRASTSVKNTGSISGATVAQLYLAFPQDSVPAGTPKRVLRGFEKVRLRPGESKKVSFPLTRRDLSYWDVTAQEWRMPRGEFTVHIGFSSRDLPQEVGFRVG